MMIDEIYDRHQDGRRPLRPQSEAKRSCFDEAFRCQLIVSAFQEIAMKIPDRRSGRAALDQPLQDRRLVGQRDPRRRRPMRSDFPGPEVDLQHRIEQASPRGREMGWRRCETKLVVPDDKSDLIDRQQRRLGHRDQRRLQRQRAVCADAEIAVLAANLRF
jgi:hypothetical protein